jgi:hypothetical protein
MTVSADLATLNFHWLTDPGSRAVVHLALLTNYIRPANAGATTVCFTITTRACTAERGSCCNTLASNLHKLSFNTRAVCAGAVSRLRLGGVAHSFDVSVTFTHPCPAAYMHALMHCKAGRSCTQARSNDPGMMFTFMNVLPASQSRHVLLLLTCWHLQFQSTGIDQTVMRINNLKLNVVTAAGLVSYYL